MVDAPYDEDTTLEEKINDFSNEELCVAFYATPNHPAGKIGFFNMIDDVKYLSSSSNIIKCVDMSTGYSSIWELLYTK